MKRKLSIMVLALMLVFVTGCQGEAKEEATDENKEQVTEEGKEEDKEAADDEKDVTEEENKEASEEEGKEEAKEVENKTLMMATTTSTADTGLLDFLAEEFTKDTGIELKYTAVGTGAAIKMGSDGEVDIILVHAKSSEEKFVEEGSGVERFPVMYNDFVIVGPAEPIEKSDSIEKVLTEINEKQLDFINRGDDSGTDKKEKKLWAALEIDPSSNPNYIESGQGMGDTLIMANEKKAYLLTDRGTFLKMKNDASVGLELDIVCEGDEGLFNQYGVIAVNPEKHENANIDAANAFIEWIRSEKAQNLIKDFGKDKYGQALFVPNANTDN